MVGADTHFNYNSPYATVPAIKKLLLSSNFARVRDSSAGAFFPMSIALQVSGETAQTIAAHVRANPKYDSFELCGNEIDGGGNKNWKAQLQACIDQESPLVKPYGKPIVAPSLVTYSDQPILGNQYPKVDAGNLHFGTCGDNPLTTRYATWATAIANTRKVAPQVWVTETNYDSRRQPTRDLTMYGRSCAIPDRYIAAYDVRDLIVLANLGVTRVNFYQFADMPSDVVFGGTGLVNPNGTPKPQYTAVNTYLGILADKSPAFALKPLDVTFNSGPAVTHLVAEKRDGSVYVVMARELRDVQWETQAPIANPPAPASVKIAGYNVSSVWAFQPNGSATQTPASGAMFATYLAVDPVVVKFVPAPGGVK